MRRYWILNPKICSYHPKVPTSAKQCQTLLSTLGFKHKTEYQLGKTKVLPSRNTLPPFKTITKPNKKQNLKVFGKHELQKTLNEKQEQKMTRYILLVQSKLRMGFVRKSYLSTRKKIISLQEWFRKCLAKKRFETRLHSYRKKIEHNLEGFQFFDLQTGLINHSLPTSSLIAIS